MERGGGMEREGGRREGKYSLCGCLCSIFDCVEELEYCRVTLTGYYDHSRELHMWPRGLNSADIGTASRRGSEPGACIITPFYCYELGEWILVNRGWVPRRKMDPSTRSIGQVCVCVCERERVLKCVLVSE